MKRVPALDELNRMLAADGLAVGVPLGFANSYALAMVATQAAALGIARISDLARHPRAPARAVAGVPEPQGRLGGAEGGLRAAVLSRADSITGSPTRRWRPGSST